MSVNGWSLIRFVHVLSAMGWVGGQLFLSAVLLPVLRRRLPPDERGTLIHETARRFASMANTALLPLLVVSGVAIAWHRGVTFASLGDPGYGRLLAIKLVFVVASIALAAGHGVLASRRPSSARPMAIAGLVSSVAIVVFATALVP
ncbi:DUF4149 domain-containing protein [Actinospongicola halichondriae]|uniref:DUF4149 domain-containing protein n=1 Tax=Actinospongicola halichondriae TaxID=3236844 RepID=UPI003D45265A